MIILKKYNLMCKGKLYKIGEVIPETAFSKELLKLGYAESVNEPAKPQPKKAQPQPQPPAQEQVQGQ